MIADLGIPPLRTAILRAVHEATGDATQSEVARRLGADPMNIKRAIDQMEGFGLINSSVTDKGKLRLITLSN